MNIGRIWILRLAALTAIAFGISFLYASYSDFSWGRLALAEAGGPSLSRVMGEIASESANRNRDGRTAEYAGLLLISTGLLMEGIAASLKDQHAHES